RRNRFDAIIYRRERFGARLKLPPRKPRLQKVSPHALRHLFARHLPENHYDIGAAQKLPCHKDVRTTQTYTHVLIK
ncbi:tyrosine-type recombinase/integrase, partial [Escherichia coli]|nr:tyrosine-type recombinase/integrase [Escherichia coli]